MKNNYFDLAIAERRLVMEQTAIRLSLPVQAVEKDLWVTAMLQILFGLPCAGRGSKAAGKSPRQGFR